MYVSCPMYLPRLISRSRVWDAATGQCLRTIVHEDNAPVTTARFSPNGRYILAFTLDSCIRLWDYVSGTCKKTYQGHVNTKYALGGAFGVTGSDAFIASGSETGEILFWDVKSKDIVQRVSGHEGPVMWVDTCPGQSGTLVSGGLDGTVRIWVDVNEDEHGHTNGMRQDHENDTTPQGLADDDSGTAQVKIENGDYGDHAKEGMSVDGPETPAQDAEVSMVDMGPDEMLE
jgi:COMPASS component SWD3